MSYFDKSFQLVVLGTQVSGGGAGQNPNPNLTDGFVTAAGVPTVNLTNTSGTAALNYGPGSYGFFDPKNGWTSVTTPSNCCPMVLAAAAPYSSDKLGASTHGGYKETVKSKLLNPRYITKFWRVDPCDASNMVINVGYTPYTSGQSPSIDGCCPEFLCGETYYLRVEVKGEAALRFANHQLYQNLQAYTGCCPTEAPTAANSTNVMIAWANEIVNSPYLQAFVQPVVYGEDGNIYYAPGTAGAALTWDIYDQTTAHVAGKCAGLILYGAYVDTQFSNCSFSPLDNFRIQPVEIFASEVDIAGDPCTFSGICVTTECPGNQGQGYGETLLRELIQSEYYLCNDWNDDPRLREVLQMDQLFNYISRTSKYYTYFIEHIVTDRTQNPSSTNDNDRYVLMIVSTVQNAALEAFMNGWLTDCPVTDCVGLETFGCSSCAPVVPQVP